MRSSMIVLAVAGLVALSAGGCGRNDNPTVPAPTASSPTTVAASVPTSGAALFAGGTTQVSTPPTAPGHLTAVEVGAHEGFERVVFTFADVLPGYRIGPVSGPFVMDGSGQPVAVAGTGHVEAHFSASGYDSTAGKQTYTGASRVPGPRAGRDDAVITEVVRTGDFEGYLSWVIGTRLPAKFLVTTLTNPIRVVVDLGF